MAPSPSPVIPDWRRVERCYPRSSQIGVGFRDLISIGAGFGFVLPNTKSQLPKAAFTSRQLLGANFQRPSHMHFFALERILNIPFVRPSCQGKKAVLMEGF